MREYFLSFLLKFPKKEGELPLGLAKLIESAIIYSHEINSSEFEERIEWARLYGFIDVEMEKYNLGKVGAELSDGFFCLGSNYVSSSTKDYMKKLSEMHNSSIKIK